jgi:hypothetical protein
MQRERERERERLEIIYEKKSAKTGCTTESINRKGDMLHFLPRPTPIENLQRSWIGVEKNHFSNGK